MTRRRRAKDRIVEVGFALALRVPCPRCGAVAGAPCVALGLRGGLPGKLGTGQPIQIPHMKRRLRPA